MPFDLGEHCSKPGCHQNDFLPFACDCCAGVFCLEHRTYDAHSCPNAGRKDSRAITCPLCRATIPLTNDQDVNVIFEQHTRAGNCNPESYNDRKKAKARCEAENCREILTASNTMQCPTCRKKVCLRHRFETDHQCKRQRHVPPSHPKASTTRTTPSSSTAQLQQRLNSVGTSVSSTVSRLVGNAKNAFPASTTSAAVTTSTDACPICQQTFRYTSQLIAHVNNAHPDVSGSRNARPATAVAAPPPAPGTAEACPYCRATFSEVTQLVAHVERDHGNVQNKSECIAM
ncbi:hypothetical protein H257_00785 [Aphanomyces astaci]|uniref:AN1-type domain-containing protein n=1 Tax=Aphanomyces astaci TaxID=112090 RepID=W4HEJ3_APHAT|nr:hypothetical protein H257_00785 [Aphanomyces astaci]ETV89548.1 hypothetical protein H257_00785 [Aphanomyces astaci]|eukprot:XP_009821948.1 hypothetical protein H257_00785 [Aphanomyces astaci]